MHFNFSYDLSFNENLPIRQVLPLNDEWLYSPEFDERQLMPDYTEDDFERIRIPHSVSNTPLAYFSEKVYTRISCYKRVLFVSQDWNQKSIRLCFEGVAHKASVYINGKWVMDHLGGYTAFWVNLNDHVTFGAENQIVVKVDSHETLNIPPFGNVIDYMTYGGIYREVSLEILPLTHLEDCFIYGEALLTPEPMLVLEPSLMFEGNEPLAQLKMEVSLFAATLGHRERASNEPLLKRVFDAKNLGKTLKLGLADVAFQLWAPDLPQRYEVCLKLLSEEKEVDRMSTFIGLRDAVFEKDGFYLNGKKLKLRGLNRHQSYAYTGYAMPWRAQWQDAQILKHELGCNAVRTSHYPQSKHFMEACETLGLLVFTELPGWQHIGNEDWKTAAVQMLEEMILQYRNFASIVLWGVRINESQDDEAFYRKTNDIARRLDPTRQTGGVRFIKKSQQFEDVYTFNDFSYNGKFGTLPRTRQKGTEAKARVASDLSKGYLVSEFNGHMYPTKSYDSSLHRTEHALRHAHVLNAVYEEPETAGGFGWCLFDYNTHKDFGSGDHICHHGVLDMFRNPKMAAQVYASQQEETPVLAVSSEMNIGDYPGGFIGTVYAFTNGEAVDLYKNDQFVKRFVPDRRLYAGLPHPPVVIDDLIGDTMALGEGYSKGKAERVKALLMAGAEFGADRLPLKYKLMALRLMVLEGFKLSDGVRLYSQYIGNWGDAVTTYRFEAIKEGQVVARLVKSPVDGVFLRVLQDTETLVENGTYDVASIRIQSVDPHGNMRSYDQESVKLSVSGGIELIGPDVVSLRGGMAGTYVRSTGSSEKGILVVERIGSKPVVLTFTTK